MAISWNTGGSQNTGTPSGGIKWGNDSQTPAVTPTPAAPQQSFADSIWNGLANSGVGKAVSAGGQAVNQAMSAPGQSLPERVINAAGAAAGAVPNVAAAAIPGGSAVLGAIGEVGGGIVNAAANVGDTLGGLASKIPGVSFNQNQYDTNNANFANSSAGQGIERAATVGQSAGNVANLALGGMGIAKGLQSGVNAIQDTASTVRGINAVAKTVTPEAPLRADPAVTQSNLAAIDPTLKGKGLVAGYKQAVTGGRVVTPANIFTEQGLAPTEQTINSATRLATPLKLQTGEVVKPVTLSGNPIANLQQLGSALDSTETSLNTALDANSHLPANKPVLTEALDAGKSAMPREYTGIRESASTYEKVIDFAKEKVDAAADNPKGIREARVAFDSQASREFPSAYQNGVIDTKTPAGQAIKFARDTMNKHLYSVAQNSPDLQALVGREADIFRATEGVAPRAASGEGQTKLQQIAKKYPNLSHYLKYAAAGAVGAEAVRGL